MRVLSSAVLVLAVLGAVGCNKPKSSDNVAADPNDAFVQSIQGNYTCTYMAIGGRVAPAEKIKSVSPKYVVRGYVLIALSPNGGEDPISFRVDTSKKPHWAEFEEKQGLRTRKPYGLMKYEGNVLTLAMAKSENPADRPTDFQAINPVHATIVLKRD